MPQRQPTLRALVAWSHQLCSEPEKQLWRILSVFTGGFELDAAQAVSADMELVDTDVTELIVGRLLHALPCRRGAGRLARPSRISVRTGLF